MPPQTAFAFRPQEQGGSVRYPETEHPIFNLDSVTRALAGGWDPNTLWLSEDDLVFPPPGSGCVMPSIADAWAHWNTPLQRAMYIGWEELGEVLLEHGADINALNSAGRTVLHGAVDGGMQGCFRTGWSARSRWAVEHGADVNMRTEARKFVVRNQSSDQTPRDEETRGGWTVLRMAMLQRSIEKVGALIKAGADVNLSLDEEGVWKPLDLALLYRRRDMVELLRGAGATFSSPEHAEAMPDETLVKQSAGDLLDFCLRGSESTLPAPGAERAFRRVIKDPAFIAAWAADAETNPDAESFTEPMAAADVLFAKISALAERRDPNAVPESYCEPCREAIRHLAGAADPSRGPFRHASSPRDLIAQTAAGCPLCGMLLDTLEAGSGREKPQHSEGHPVKLTLREDFGRYSLMVDSGGRTKQLHTDFLEGDLLHGILQHPDDDQQGSGSDRAMAVAKAWMERCRTHPECQRPQNTEDPLLPSRILDLGTIDNSSIRLIETDGTQRGTYVALSLRQSGHLSTTKSTLEQHRTGIQLDDLPPGICDAITTTRALGFRYLWSNAVCVIQDDPVDIDSEATRMGTTFSRASLTISSLVAQTDAQHLFAPRTLRQSHPLPLPVPSRPAGWYNHPPSTFPILAALPAVERGEHDGTPKVQLSKAAHDRPGALQELIPSARILWFAEHELQWECVRHYAAESTPGGVRSDNIGRKYSDESQHLRRLVRWEVGKHAPDGEPREQQVIGAWEDLVASYTKKKETREGPPGDLVPGIIGLAELMRPALGTEFLAGIWKSFCMRGLLWNVDHEASRHGDGDAGVILSAASDKYPSWTWASRPGMAMKYSFSRASGSESTKWHAEVVSLDILPQGKSHASATGSVTLKGPLGRVTGEQIDELRKALEFDHMFSFGADRKVYMDAFPEKKKDGKRDVGSVLAGVSDGFWYLEVLETEATGPHKGYGLPAFPNGRPGGMVILLLEPVGDAGAAPRVFRRIGVARLTMKDAENLGKLPMCEVKVV